MTINNDQDVIIFFNKLISEVRSKINDEKMINKCDMCQGLIGRYLDSLNIPYYPCSTNTCISNNVVGHSFIVAFIGGNYYLIDPAFVQFQYGSSEDVIIKGIKCISKSPYYYLNNMDKELTFKLINDGYFKLDEKTAYVYGNAFYYTKTNIPACFDLTPIKGDTFINSFLKGNDKLRDYDDYKIKNK